MGYLKSGLGSMLKVGGGLASAYAGYKLATENGAEIKDSLEGAAEGLEATESGMGAVYGFLDGTSEEIEDNPQYGDNLRSLGLGLGAFFGGRHLKGQNEDIYRGINDFLEGRYTEG